MKLEPRHCELCGGEIPHPRGLSANQYRARRFCDRECWNKYLSINREKECHARETSVWTNCRCEACRIKQRKLEKRARAHAYQRRVPPEAAWAKVLDLVDRGYSAQAIAIMAGLHHRVISAALKTYRETGRKRRWSTHYAESLVKLNVANHTHGRVRAIGTVRRLQALAAIGYDGAEISSYSDMLNRKTLSYVRATEPQSVMVWLEKEVRRIYDALYLTPGRNQRIKNRAIKRGWAPPLCWDNIDDPSELPKGTGYELVIRSTRYVGVAWDASRQLWRARLRMWKPKKVSKLLGYFETEEEAAEAIAEYKAKLAQEGAQL